MTNSEEESLHHKVVYKILPEFAKKLKEEGLISGWDRKQFRIQVVKGREPVRVNPDLTLHVPDRGKVVVEVVNPRRNPKRYIGELVYPHILGNLQRIGAAIFLVLHYPRSRRSERAISQELSFQRFFKKTIPDIVLYLRASDLEKIDLSRDQIYKVFKGSVMDYKNNGKFY